MADRKTHESFARLENDPDFKAVLEEVQRRKEAARLVLEQASDLLAVGRAQGEVRAYEEFLELARMARSVVEKVRTRKGHPED